MVRLDAILLACALAWGLQLPASSAAAAPPSGLAGGVPVKAVAAPLEQGLIDVDGDGRYDLVGLDARRGVRVLFGNGTTQTVERAQLGDPEAAHTAFGAGFVVADLNADGYSDILLSDWTMNHRRGVVWVIWGSASGVSSGRTAVLLKGTDVRRPLGASLAFVPARQPVLAVGVKGLKHPGGIMLFRVGPTGRPGAHRFITVGSAGVTGSWGPEVDFGGVLSASGDLLVVGAAKAGPKADGGAVWVFQLLPGLRYWVARITRDTPGVPGRAEAGDAFGTDVSVLNDWVAVSAPGQRVRGTKLRGAVQGFRVERTGHGLRIHPGRVVTARNGGWATGLSDAPRARQVLVTWSMGDYGVVINAGPVQTWLTRGFQSDVGTAPLVSGTTFTLVRSPKSTQPGDDATLEYDLPAVVNGSTITVGQPGSVVERDAGSDSTWDASAAVFAAPAA